MPANSYYNHDSNQPVQLSRGSSAAIRSEFKAIENAFYEMEQSIAAASSSADFRLIYQGARSADPTQRYNGTQLQNGDLYFNTGAKVMKSFADGAWYALATASSAMLKDGGAFTGPISGTTASFSSSVTAAGFSGNGSQLTGFTLQQISNAIGFTPLNSAGGSMTGQLNGTTASYTGSVTASDFIMTSDERKKMKWAKLPDDLLDQIAAVKKIGFYTDKKTKRVKVGVGAQSLAAVLPEAVLEDPDGFLGVAYGPASLVLIHKLIQRVQLLEKRLAKLEK